MKIKEKGLTGKSAALRKQNIAGSGRGFNAFREMSQAGKGKDKDGKDKPKAEVWLEFLGSKIRVHDEDGGTIKPEDVPFVKGASLKFDGVEGDVDFDQIKVRFHLHAGLRAHERFILTLIHSFISYVIIGSAQGALYSRTIRKILKR